MISIVTDSTSYFTKEEATKLDLRVVSANYSADGKNYHESFSDCNGDYEELLKANSNNLQTSHANVYDCLSAFESIIRNGNEALFISISSRLSGTYNSASLAAKQLGSKNIMVLDSLSTAGGLYLLVKKATELAQEGFSLKVIYDKLTILRDKIILAFSVDDMAPLRKSGRIGIVRMSVSTILNIKPILLCVDGAIVSDIMVRGKHELFKELTQKVPLSVKEVVINYIGNNTEASNFYAFLKQTHPNSLISMRKLGPVLGVHLGLGVLSVACISE
jgi:DegV family protein with EDD domain